jgi:PAS domain S-box-containing protein
MTNPNKPKEGLVNQLFILKEENHICKEENYRSNRLFGVARRIIQTTVRIKNKEELFEKICDHLVGFEEFGIVWIGLTDGQSQTIKPVAFAGKEDGYLSAIQPIQANDFLKKEETKENVIYSEKHSVYQHLSTDPLSEPWKVEAIKRGYQSSIVLSIKQAGKIAGVIVIYTAEINFFDDSEIQLLKEIGDDINDALNAIELDSQSQQAATDLMNNERQLRLPFENMTGGFLLFELILDEDRNPADYRLIEANPAMDQYSKLKRSEEIGKTSSELSFNWPDEITNRYYQVALSGKPFRYERFNESMGKYYDVRVFSPCQGQFALLVYDITGRKLAEKRLVESKALLRSIIDGTDDLIWTVDVNRFGLLDWNPSFKKYFTEVVGRSIQIGATPEELFTESPEYVDQWHQFYARVKKSDTFTTEFQENQSGQTFLLTLNLLKSEGLEFGISVFAKNITQMRAIEAEALRNKQHFQTMFEEAPLGMALVDSFTGRFCEVNDKFAKINQRTKEELKSINWMQLSHPDDISNDIKGMARINAGEIDSLSKEKRYVRPDGTVIWIKIIIIPIKETNHKHTRHLCMVEDITEEKQMFVNLVQAKENAEESDRLKTAFLANMSHEIRTPINSIIGFSNLLFDPAFDQETQKEFTNIIRQSGKNLLFIINDIIDLSKIETGLLKMNKYSFPVTELLISLYKDFEPEAQKKKIDLRFFYPVTDERITVCSDKERIYQILNNLIDNALKFTKKGFIEFGAVVGKDCVQFYVNDTGIGIAPENHEKIFERFRQIECSYVRQHGGNGLGLTLCKQLTELLGGKIWLESEIGKGSTFYFTIPYS